MISLLPKPYSAFNCPCCLSSSITVKGNFFQGIHWLAEAVCNSCSVLFLADFPIGHALFFPSTWIVHDNWKLTTAFEANWFQRPVQDSLLSPVYTAVSIKRIIKTSRKEVIILNCLDYLYGHVLLKLWNAHLHLQETPHLGLVVIIPESFEWLVPDGVSEIWSVPVSLKDCLNYYPALNQQIQTWLCEYSTVWLSLAHSHPDCRRLPIQNYTRIAPFPIEEFCNRSPVITFIYREDRLWLRNHLEEKLWQAAKKYQFSSVLSYLLTVQQKQITDYFETLHRLNPNIELRIVGLGEPGDLPIFVKDYRKTKLSPSDERAWCQCYSESHLVIGIHGSNMLLPTAHAAGFIEILPQSRWGNLMQDIASPHQGRLLHFLGRFVDEFVSARQLARLTNEIIVRYPFFELSMTEQFLSHEPVSDVSRWTEFLNRFVYRKRN
ncbi:MAG: hypothetical protein NZ108_02570 [Bacteroidia bacterium]|nr:hypothetical protein [Bacteroidia bacterium]